MLKISVMTMEMETTETEMEMETMPGRCCQDGDGTKDDDVLSFFWNAYLWFESSAGDIEVIYLLLLLLLWMLQMLLLLLLLVLHISRRYPHNLFATI